MNQQLHHILCGLIAIAAGVAWGAPSDLAQTPLSVTQTVRPMVLLALSNDHQLYRKAYNDYSDLDGDGAIDTTYQSGYEYYGYFDPKKCYVYSVAGYFEPTGKATPGHRCNPGISGQDSGTWSGNLLNWATMTRMDILRRVLYGGYRSIDDPAQTILERVLLPTDSHAFAKVFTPPGGTTEMGRHTPTNDYGTITFCNVTWASDGESQSLNTSTYPPLIRVAKGNWSMWASGEVTECAWREVKSADTTAPWESNNSDVSPVRVGSKLYQLNARVAVCVSGWLEDNCRDYKDDISVVHNKPTGLLQKYGENGSLRFGLMSGSYNKNLSGGVLRRKIGLIAGNTEANAALDEINLKTGQFITTNKGIISTINAFRINKYSFGNRKYSDCNTYGIPLCTLTPNEYCLKNGVCTNWGNPVSEIFFESLRYLAGKREPYAPYNADDHSYFGTLTPIPWDDPMPVAEWCAKSNIIFLSTGVNSFDRDEFSSDFTDLDLTTGTNLIGAQDDIGTNLIVGGSTTGQCTAKAVDGLANAQGICPEGPTLDGGYQVAAVAHFAHTTGLRRVKDQQQKVNTQTVALARDLPRFNIPVGNNTVTLLPHMEASKNAAAVQSTAGWRTGTLQDLIVENLTKDQSGRLVSASLRVIWEDSTWGNDYDMDGVERIQFCVGPTACTQVCNACSVPCNTTCNRSCTNTCETKYQTCLNGCSTSTCETNCYNTRTTCNTACPATCATTCANTCASECNTTVAENELKITTSVQQASAGNALLFGYTIAGTVSGSTPTNTKCDGAYHGDGVYREVVRTGGKNFSMLTDPQDTPSNKPVDCVRKFQAGTNTARLPEHPLWYGAKYGGFIDANANALPDTKSEWDTNNDGVPDRFFFADNPAQLGKSLETFLEIIATVSSSAAVVANSVTLQENTFIFQGRYDSADWSGDLVAFPVNFVDGSLSTLVWSGRSQIDIQGAAGNRRIITTNADRVANGSATLGVPFAWGNTTSDDDDGIADSQKWALSGNCDVCTEEELTIGETRLDYLRGSRTHEAANGGLFRTRIHLMGDVVNSTPIYVGEPAAFYPDDLDAAPYSTFAAAQAERQHVIYVGANDGMLHGFKAAKTTSESGGGAEIFAFIPRAVYPKLAALTASNYREYHQAYVDSGATAGDAYLPGKQNWRTILVGGLGAGGRGIYALDITEPADYLISEADAANQVLWDIVGGDTGFTHLGYTYSKPAIVRMPDDTYGGIWTVVFGNGYESPDGKAVLYVVDAETGTRKAEIVVDEGPDNGLSSVAPVDYNGDGDVDYIYAGDLKGNLWRFETADNAGMIVSFAGDPLFNDGVSSGVGADPVTTAITVRPEVVSHPVRGVVVLFGTGSYYRKGDGGNSDPKNDRIPHPSIINAFYGIWDKRDGTSDIDRSHLLKQQILGTAVAGSYDVRVTSDHPINWHLGTGKPTPSDPPTHLGWYLELRQPLEGVGEGELQVTNPQARGGRIIFTTLIPADTTTALCDFGGDGWLMELNALTGGRMTEVVFDLNADTYFNAADLVTVREQGTDVKRAPSGKKSLVGIIQEPAIISAGTKEYKYTSGAREAAIEVTLENPGDPERGRRAWMQLQ